MKDQTSAIITAVALAYATLRIYQKYFKKDKEYKKSEPKKKNDSLTSMDDDYEPYTKK